jgi:hypothetical protein
MTITYRLLTSLAAGLLTASAAAAETLVQLRDLDMDELRVAGFELTRGGKVTIEAVGLLPRHADELTAYAWILDSKTREALWVMLDRNTERHANDRRLRQETTTLTLDPGRYELYFWAGERWSWNQFGFGTWIRKNFDSRNDDDYDVSDNDDRNNRKLERALDECFVRVDSDDLRPADVRSFQPDGAFGNALVRHVGLGDAEFIEDAFRLSRSTRLRIHAIVEFPEDWRHPADNGWIINAGTRERVFDLDYANTRHAGGAEKNRLFDDEIELPAGDYVLVFGTDDSHSYPDFNSAPPHDPLNWGITIQAAASGDAGAFTKIDVPGRGEPIVAMTRVRDSQYLEQAFRIRKKGTVQIYALGEYGNGEFADHGWIESAGDERVVWEMTRRNTDHAGGAEKNRMFDGSVELEPGEYRAIYLTDNSHSFREWNSDAPFDREAWGLTLFAGSLKATDVELISQADAAKDGETLVQLTRVGDDERVRESFTLDKESSVRIYALGEGVDGEMYDYGYIVDEDNDVVWEMDFRRTRHAGGAQKNRVIDRVVKLPAGRYTVVYETDGSHSFPDWNDTQPRDPRHWGITVSVAQ